MSNITEEVQRYAGDVAMRAKALNFLLSFGTVGDLHAASDSDDRVWIKFFPGDEYEADDDVWSILNTEALEIKAEGEWHSHTGWELTGITVVTGVGGPHVEFTVYEDGDVVGRCFWGLERHTSRLRGCQHLYEALREIIPRGDTP